MATTQNLLAAARPLKERVLRGSDDPSRPIATGILSSRPMNYKVWNEDKMRRAMEAVIVEGKSIRIASNEYGVPKSTLGDRISGRCLPGVKSGPPTYLTPEEEEELATFITRCASIGYGKTQREVICLVERILHSRGQVVHISSGWWKSFAARHPYLTLRVPAQVSSVRYQASSPEIINAYFDLLEETLIENELIDEPCHIFNMDESGMPLDPKPLKTIHFKGEQHPSAFSSGNKKQITVVGCCSAAGQCLPPMVIWNRKTLNPRLAEGEVPGTIYGLSANGWMDLELFHMWFSRHFLRYAPPSRPLLLLLDGHSSHFCPDTIRLAAEERVILFTLPPHTTHITQPLDKGVFGPLKTHWRDVCHSFLARNPGRVITQYDFSALFSTAWIDAMTVRNIMSGFRITGVFPVSRDAVHCVKDQQKLTEKTGLSFIPLYTPSKRRLSAAYTTSPTITFSETELIEFEEAYQNEHLVPGQRYSSWLRMYHPEDDISNLIVVSTSSDDSLNQHQLYSTASRQSSLSKFVRVPSPILNKPSRTGSSSSRVLTSKECIQKMEEKERAKQELQQKKEENMKRRQDNARKRSEVARLKAMKEKKQTGPGEILSSDQFTPDEVAKNMERYENGYNVLSNTRYMQWLRTFDADAAESLTSKQKDLGSHRGSVSEDVERGVLSPNKGGDKSMFPPNRRVDKSSTLTQLRQPRQPSSKGKTVKFEIRKLRSCKIGVASSGKSKGEKLPQPQQPKTAVMASNISGADERDSQICKTQASTKNVPSNGTGVDNSASDVRKLRSSKTGVTPMTSGCCKRKLRSSKRIVIPSGSTVRSGLQLRKRQGSKINPSHQDTRVTREDSDELEEDEACSAIICIIGTTDDLKPKWIQCDSCKKWFHMFCVGLSLAEAACNFFCEFCDIND